MKKIVVLLIVLLLGLSAFACAVSEALIELTENTRIIEAEAFYGIPSIKRVVLPEGVREIGARAFAQSGLMEINLPDSLVFIDDTAFEGCGPLVVTANKGSAAYEWAVRHAYISDVGDYTNLGFNLHQHVQAYPENSGFVLFRR